MVELVQAKLFNSKPQYTYKERHSKSKYFTQQVYIIPTKLFSSQYFTSFYIWRSLNLLELAPLTTYMAQLGNEWTVFQQTEKINKWKSFRKLKLEVKKKGQSFCGTTLTLFATNYATHTITCTYINVPIRMMINIIDHCIHLFLSNDRIAVKGKKSK